MAYLRLNTLLAIPLGDCPPNPTIQQIKDRLPQEMADHLVDYIREVRQAKKYATRINEGRDNEEMTIVAQWHICRHDEQNKPCEAGQEI